MSGMTVAIWTSFILGFASGAVSLFYTACRVGFHKWNRWTLAANGGGQTRTCDQCGLMQPRPFRDFRVKSVEEPELRPEL